MQRESSERLSGSIFSMPVEEMVPNKQPPDRPMVDRELQEGISFMGEGRNSEAEIEADVRAEGVRGKLQRTDGSFTGEVSLKAREEEWMMEHDMVGQGINEVPLSYREALRPKTNREREQERMNVEEEAWDGNLLFDDEEEMLRGISVTDSDKGPMLNFSEEERKRLERYWQNTLIVKLLGGAIGFMQMRRKVQAMWGKSGRVELNVVGNGFMLASFSSMDDYYFALEGRPWLIQNHYLTVQTWKRNFDPWNECLNRVAVWVRLPRLPVDYYDKKFFYALGNQIGRAIKVDEMTFTKARTMYARMCVEVDLNAPLLPAYSVDGNNLKVEYEGLHMICFGCGKFGHNLEQCSSRKEGGANASDDRRNNRKENVREEENQRRRSEDGNSSIYGEWMVVQETRRGRRPTQKTYNAGEPSRKEMLGAGRVGSSSRFTVLEVEGEVEVGDKAGDSVRKPMKDISNEGRREERTRREKEKSKERVEVSGKDVLSTARLEIKRADRKKEGRGAEREGKKETAVRTQDDMEGELRRDILGLVKAQTVGLDNKKQKEEIRGQALVESNLGHEEKNQKETVYVEGNRPIDLSTMSSVCKGGEVMEVDEEKPPDPLIPMEVVSTSDERLENNSQDNGQLNKESGKGDTPPVENI